MTKYYYHHHQQQQHLYIIILQNVNGGIFRGGTLRLASFGMRKILGVTHKRKTCALTCQICGYFVRE